MNMTYIQSLKTPIAVIGMGKSGKSAVAVLKQCRFKESDILTFDENPSHAKISDVATLLTEKPRTLVVSPGVPLNLGWLKTLIADGAHLTSELTLAASLITTEKIIGVTGSVGKSTVASLLGVGVKKATAHFFVGGNLGTPFCEYALQLLTSGRRADWVILELSSFQLENCSQLFLDYSIITYLSANHLERYPSLESYYQTKLTIGSITKNICLLNASSADCVRYASELSCKTEVINAKSFSFHGLLSSLLLFGEHNKDNFSLAAELAKFCGWPLESVAAMCSFHGLPHRLEYVVEINGVTYVNDSKATSIDSVFVAINSCLEKLSAENKLFVLIGGKDKNLPWQQLSVFCENERLVPIFFGACGQHAKESSGLTGEYFERLGSAINFGQRRAASGDIVLLCPGGTSLDEFKNFEERGDFFKSLVLSDFEA